MVDYTTSLIWLTLWPIVIYGSYRLVLKNISNYEKRVNNDSDTGKNR